MTDLPQANKRLGQRWLSDKSTLEDIVEFAGVEASDIILEVGPGVGTLTEVLANKAKKVVAVEYDQELALPLAAKFADTNVQIIPDDIMQFDFQSLPKGYKVVANIPYYLTSNLLRRLLESHNPPMSTTLLVQKEVAERIAAPAGKMSVLSVSAQFFCEVRLGEVVHANMFSPPPKVDSQVVRLDYRPQPLFPDINENQFFRVVKAGFAERRKKLRSSLAKGLSISKGEAEQLLKSAHINPDARAQELTLQQWHDLCQTQA